LAFFKKGYLMSMKLYSFLNPTQMWSPHHTIALAVSGTISSYRIEKTPIEVSTEQLGGEGHRYAQFVELLAIPLVDEELLFDSHAQSQG